MAKIKKYLDKPFDGAPDGPLGFGIWVKNPSNERDGPFTTVPSIKDFQEVRVVDGAGTHRPQITNIWVRYAWKALQPVDSFAERGTSAYKFDEFVGTFLDMCGRARIYGRVQIQTTNNNEVKFAADKTIKEESSPVPLFLFRGGFHKEPEKATLPYGGGCYYITFPNKNGDAQWDKHKLWPRMWLPAVYQEYAEMNRQLLNYIRAHPNGKWFAGLGFDEMFLQNGSQIVGNVNSSTLDWTMGGVRDGYLHIIETIGQTWNEPLHGCFANWMGGVDYVDKQTGEEYWKAVFDKAYGEYGFAHGSPDTYSEHGSGMIRADKSALGSVLFPRWRNKTPIIIGTQRSGSIGPHGKKGQDGVRDVISVATTNVKDGANVRKDMVGTSLEANIFCCALLKTGENWDLYDFFDYTAKADGLKTKSMTSISDYIENTPFSTGGGPAPGLPAPSNLRVENGLLAWDYTTVDALKGFRVWVSDTDKGEPKSGTKRFNTGSPSARSVLLASLAPPAAGHWLCIQARGAGAQSLITSIQVAAVTALAAPTQVCVNFGDETISWTYTNATGNPALGFHIYVDDVLIKITGPGKRAIPRLRSTWTNATEYDVKVEAVGALGVASLTRTFTYANETTGSSCTA